MAPQRASDNDHDATLAQPQPQPMKDESTAMDVEVTQTTTTNIGPSEGIVYVAVDGYMSQAMEIKVCSGNDIDDIKKKIIESASNTFGLCNTARLRLFESKKQTTKQKSNDEDTEEPLTPVLKPMNATTQWNSKVTWGTEKQPLIVCKPSIKQRSKWDVECKYPDQKKEGDAFVKSIMKDYVDIPSSNGMRVLHGVISLEGKGKSNIVLRNITEHFWKGVIDATKDFHVCAVGTPGIGKTSSSCILIRLLLRDKKTVVYRILGNNYIFMFSPAATNIDVKVIRENDFEYDDANIDNDSVYYVVDPGKNNSNSCDLSSRYQGQVIIVASPNDQHWGGSQFFKGRSSKQGTLMFFPVWNLQELLDASSVFASAESVLTLTALIKDRFARLGGVPRYIFASDTDYNNQIQAQERALAELSSDAAVSLAYSDRSAIISQSSSLPKGILLSYMVPSPDGGEKYSEYRVGHAVFASDYIYDFVVAKYKVQLWKQMVSYDVRYDPYLYEVYVRKLFVGNIKPPSEKRFTIKKIVSKKKNATTASTKLGGCIGCEKVEDIVTSAMTTSKVVFHPYSSKHVLLRIDFIYRVDGNPATYNCFQCTMNDHHSARSEHIYALVRNITSRTRNEKARINIYYAVPQHRFQYFVTNPVDPSEQARKYCAKQIGEKSYLYLNWDKIVLISAVCIDPPDDPSTTLQGVVKGFRQEWLRAYLPCW